MIFQLKIKNNYNLRKGYMWNTTWENDFENLWFEYCGYCGFKNLMDKFKV